MRSGGKLDRGRIGGAWQYTIANGEDRSNAFEFATAGNGAATENENCTCCNEAGCIKGTCMDGMFLQQSC